MSIKALEDYLLPFQPFLNMEGVTEICVNRPGEIFVECNRVFKSYNLPVLDYEYLHTLSSLVAEFNHKPFPNPLLFGSLPTGERIQFVLNPGCENRKVICSIRVHQPLDFSLSHYQEQGSFEQICSNNFKDLMSDQDLATLYEGQNFLEFLKVAIRKKKNILISGGTGTGKTTFLNACLKCIPENERIITVEDTREVFVNYPNVVHLLFNEDDEYITASKIFKACLRLRPDRIFLSELRGAEVWSYLRAANSGHPGSLSTIHADSPTGAFTQLVFMMQQAGSTSNEKQIRGYVESIIDIVVQLKRDSISPRHMYVSEIYFKKM